jgi:hypothetical protein
VKGALFEKELLKGKRYLSKVIFFFLWWEGAKALCIHCSELDSVECGEFLLLALSFSSGILYKLKPWNCRWEHCV